MLVIGALECKGSMSSNSTRLMWNVGCTRKRIQSVGHLFCVEGNQTRMCVSRERDSECRMSFLKLAVGRMIGLVILERDLGCREAE